MAKRSSLDENGRELAAKLRGYIATDLRAARRAAGLSQHAAAAAVGMSHAQFGRIERGALEQLTVEQACRAGMAVGLRLNARLYPDGDPVRDRGAAQAPRALPRATSGRSALGRGGPTPDHGRSPSLGRPASPRRPAGRMRGRDEAHRRPGPRAAPRAQAPRRRRRRPAPDRLGHGAQPRACWQRIARTCARSCRSTAATSCGPSPPGASPQHSGLAGALTHSDERCANATAGDPAR